MAIKEKNCAGRKTVWMKDGLKKIDELKLSFPNDFLNFLQKLGPKNQKQDTQM